MNKPLFLLSILALAAQLHVRAGDILKATNFQGGLIAYLDCGDGAAAAQIAESATNAVVHGIDRDAARIAAARERFRGSPAATRLGAETWTGTRLPYASNLVNLVIADSADLQAEIERVLAPGGVWFRSKDDSMWRKPPTPKGAEWTHYQFDASNNPVGQDSGCGLPQSFQWSGKPLWSTSHENMSSLNAMVSAKGRVFYIIDEGARASVQLPADWQLVARDAYNGVILWRQPIAQWLTRFWPWKSGPAQMPRKLVAIGDRVYAPLDINGALIEFDAATGERLQTYANSAAAEELIYHDGVLLVVVNPDPPDMAAIAKERRSRRNFNYDGRNRVVLDHDKAKRVVAYDAASGRQLWQRVGPRVSPLTLAALGDKAVYHNGAAIVCLDLRSGEERWSSDPIAEKLTMIAEESPTLVLHKDAVFYARNKKLTTFSMADGKTLWNAPWVTNDYRSPVSVMLMQGQVWSMNITGARSKGTFIGRDPVTGDIKTKFDLPPFKGIAHHRCYKAKASGDFVLLSRSGVEYVNPTTQTYDEHHWVRGACLYGILPANGMLYSTPHACACYIKGKLNGFTAMTPHSVTADGGGHLETGPAFDKPIADSAKPGDWPTYRGDVGRSGRSATPVPSDLKQSWKSEVGGELSSLTVSNGLVFVAQKDRNSIHAIREADGAAAWQFSAGGSIDSPPSIAGGRVYVGAADGYVYCLRAKDGALVWRSRAAPAERRVMAYGRLESAWPVNGSVLVQRGSVFCAAGRSSFLDGGIRLVKMSADTGEIIVANAIYDRDEKGAQPKLTSDFDMAGALPDILSSDGGSVYMRHLRFETEVLKPAPPAPHLFSPTGYLDASWWHRSSWVYGANTKGGYGGWWQSANKLPAGRLMVFSSNQVYSFGRTVYPGMNTPQFSRPGEKYVLYASKKEAGPDPNYSEAQAGRRSGRDLAIDWSKFRTTPITWQQDLSFHVRAMVLADTTLFAAGPYGDAIRSQDAFDGKRGVRLAAASAQDGTQLANYEIDALPVFDGMAAANGRLYLALQDGSIRCFGPAGKSLASKLGEAIEVLPEELETSDEAYRAEVQARLGRPVSGSKRPSKPTAAILKGKSKAADFAKVIDAKVVASDLGYRLGAKKQGIARAFHTLDAPIADSATWRFKMAMAPGFGAPDYHQNGFLAFGDGPEDERLVKCGLQIIRGTASIIEGKVGKPAATAKLDGDLARAFDITVTVDVKTGKVVMQIAGQTVRHSLKRKLKSITHVGFHTWNAVTDFSALE
jgi:outer membrane protein assembly factor BamB